VTSYKQLLRSHPERIIEKAVKGMLPHNRLGRKINKHLKVYAGSEHPHIAQNPKKLEI
jgi:large subunit ribosomal protein L13